MNYFTATKLEFKRKLVSLIGNKYDQENKSAYQMSEQQIIDFQNQKLSEMINHAIESVDFYKERKEKYKNFLNTNNTLSERLLQLPIIEKDTLRKYNNSFFSSKVTGPKKFHNTSGSTGTPVKILSTIFESAYTKSFQKIWLEKITGKKNPTILFLTGFIPKNDKQSLYSKDIFSNNSYLSVYSLGEKHKTEVIKYIKKIKPDVIFGYPSAINNLSLIVSDELQNLKSNMIAVTTSEVLEPEWKVNITNYLCAKVFNLYGSREGSHAVVECENGNMHINPLVGIIEIVDEQGSPCKGGEIGKVLVSGLQKQSMPLLRYALGDSAEAIDSSVKCKCSLSWPMIGHIHGRTEDLVITRDGRKIGRLGTVFTPFMEKGIVKAQLFQNGFEDFNFRLVIDENIYSKEVEEKLKFELEKKLNFATNTSFTYAEELLIGPKNKIKMVTVNLK